MSILQVSNLSVSYGKYSALQNVSLEVMDGEFLGIIGPNGGGKSTLLRSILNLIPYSGTIKIFGKDFKQVRNFIGYVPQIAPMDRNFPITVEEVVLGGLLTDKIKLFKNWTDIEKEKMKNSLAKVGISNLQKRRISDLSGGEFQKVLLARSIINNPKILFLDEPTANIDPSSRESIFALLGYLNKTMTLLMVTHDVMAISSNVKSIACLNKNLFYHGEPTLDENTLHAVYGCPVDLIAHGTPHRVLSQHKGAIHD